MTEREAWERLKEIKANAALEATFDPANPSTRYPDRAVNFTDLQAIVQHVNAGIAASGDAMDYHLSHS